MQKQAPKPNPFLRDCGTCKTRCDGQSRGNYQFGSDLGRSEHWEGVLAEQIARRTNKVAEKERETHRPDLRIVTREGELCARVEVKLQERTFMRIESLLPLAGLTPAETVALNLSDLQRYFEQQVREGELIYIAWILNRPCQNVEDTPALFFQDLRELQKIHALAGYNRFFKRQSGEGDVVDGVHKGVTGNYHFSLNELVAGAEVFYRMISELTPESLKIRTEGFGS